MGPLTSSDCILLIQDPSIQTPPSAGDHRKRPNTWQVAVSRVFGLLVQDYLLKKCFLVRPPFGTLSMPEGGPLPFNKM